MKNALNKKSRKFVNSIYSVVLSKNGFSSVKEDIKFSYSTVEGIIKDLVKKDYRDINKLPEEFHKFSDVIITLENPVEPEEWECCGKGCTNCVWEVYDKKVQDFEQAVKQIHDKINSL